MKNVVYSVYKHTTPDELVYIGATVQKPKARWGVICKCKTDYV